MRSEPLPGLYRHFKGGEYRVYACATNTETGERCVFYQSLCGAGECFIRPVEMFTGNVDRIKYPNVTQKKRFELIRLLPGLDKLE